MDELTKWIAATLLGFVTALVTFRVSLSETRKDIVTNRTENALNREHDKELLRIALAQIRADIEADCRRRESVESIIARRQLVGLEIMAAIARKSGVAHRALGTDALADYMGDNDNG